MHTFFNPDKEGWLWKQGGRYKSWKRRWFILNDNCLYYFEYTTDKEPRGIIPLENISVRECTDRQKQHCFELYASGGADFIKACKTDSEGKVVEGKHTVYRMSASSEEEKSEWMNRLRQSISHNPFYDMLASRKRKAQHHMLQGKNWLTRVRRFLSSCMDYFYSRLYLPLQNKFELFWIFLKYKFYVVLKSISQNFIWKNQHQLYRQHKKQSLYCYYHWFHLHLMIDL